MRPGVRGTTGPDRDVRAAGEDVHGQVRPEEVELAPRQLPRHVHRAAARLADGAVLARETTVSVQGVGLRRDVDHLGEARVSDLAVVALEEVLADELPVRLELGLPSGVVDEAVDVEPELGHLCRHRAERVGERFRVRAGVDEDERSPGSDRRRGEAELVLREVRLFLRARRGAEPAVESVRPRVVRALERLPAALALGDREAAVAADVDEGPQLAVAGERDDDRRPAAGGGEEGAGLR